MNMISFEIVRPCDEHGKLIMQWRNDQSTLAASFDQQPRTWDSFECEFRSRYFSVPGLPPLFAIEDGQRVGFVRFRPVHKLAHPSERRVEISLIVSPEHRGRGLASQILRAVSPIVHSQGYDVIDADIRIENDVSRRAFESAGYIQVGREVTESPYSKNTAEVWRYELRMTAKPISSDGVFVIAEAGSNWRSGTPARDWAMARALVDVAVDAGADAVKFQTYRPNTVYVENAGSSDYLSDAGIKEDISEIFADLAMPYEMVPRLAEYCKKQGIVFMTTPFSVADFDAVDPFVEIHKVASYELAHLRLLQKAAQSQKPLILSTGAASEDDVAWAVDFFRQECGAQLTLLQCTAKYPADASSMNLLAMAALRARFGVPVGLSDHSRDPIIAPVSAVALGASVIEKHYTLDNRLPGPDHAFAVLPSELREMVTAIRSAVQMRGAGVKEVLSAEAELASYARRGVQAIRDIEEGEVLHEGKNIEILRPGQQRLGVHPKYLVDIEGAKALRRIELGQGIQQGDW